MSMKAIRKVLEGAAEHPNAGDDVRSALAELETIEKAARVVAGWGIAFDACAPGGIPGAASEVDEAEVVLERIAAEAKARKGGG